MSRVPEPSKAQIVDAYLMMAQKARYRPGAPSDGFGHITVPVEELDLDEEAEAYAQAFWDNEDVGTWQIGCPNYEQRRAMVYLIEAAKACCSANPELAKALARLAVAELAEQTTPEDVMGERHPDRLDASAQENVCSDTVSGWLWYCDVHDTHGNADTGEEAGTLADTHAEVKQRAEGAGGEGCDLMVWRRTPHERTAG